MVKKVKTIFILSFCLAIILSFISGCFSDGSGALNQKSTSQNEDENSIDSSIGQKLKELVTKMVSPPVILSHESGEIIYGSGDKELIFIKGSAEKGNTVEIYVNGVQEQQSVAVDNNGYFETLNGVEINEGENVIELLSVSPSGIKSTSTRFSLFLVVPQKVEYSLYSDSTSLKEIGDFYYTDAANPLVYVYGNHLPASTVFIQINDKIVGQIECDSGGSFELEDVALKQGNNEVAVWAKSSSGFMSAPVFKDVVVYRDLEVPYPVNLTGYKQGNANYLSWGTSVDTDFNSYKLVRVENPCINPEYPVNDVIATFSDINSKNYIDNDIISGKSYYYTLWVLDKTGNAVSSNVVAIPKPVYSITIKPLPSTGDSTISRREWFYQPFEITNTGNVTVDVQPFMAWIKLDPSFDQTEEVTPIWEVHLWNPNESEQYYYSNEAIYETYIADWAKTSGYTTTEETTTYSTDGLTKTVTVTETTQLTEYSEVNLKRVMTTTTETTITEIDLTGVEDPVETITTDTKTELVEPEKIGSLIEGLEPGERIIVEVKIQNIAAENGEKIIAHFHFAPVDCDGHFYTDEIVSTGDVIATGRSRS